MSDDRIRRRSAVRPLKWIGKGLGRGAKGVWRVMRRGRRDRALPMASLTATLVEARLATSTEEASEWCDGADDVMWQFPQLPQLQLPSWLTAPFDSFTLSSSSSSSSSVLATPAKAVSSSSSGNSMRSTAVADHHSSSRGVQAIAQMLNTDNTFPMALQPIGSSSSSCACRTLQDPQRYQYTDRLTQQQELQQQHADDLSLISSSSSSSSSSAGQQQLLTVGTRFWGNWWDGRGLLKVKIYDFALYIDGQQAGNHLPATHSSSSSSSAVFAPQQQQQQQPEDLPGRIKAHDSGVGMSLILKAAREVPLNMLQAEYEKVLTRRLARAGGDESDAAALKQLLSGLGDPQRLPAAVRRGEADSSVARGAMIVFERSADGHVTARIGPHVLDSVRSPKLSEALFDLYLGEQPVSKSARDAAADTLHRIAQQQQQFAGYYLPRGSKELIKCDGIGSSSVSGLAGKGAKKGLGLSIADLAACELHMDH